MAKQRYIILPEDRIDIEVKEGDTGAIELTFPDFLTVAGARLFFQAWDVNDLRIFSYEETDMEIVGQTVWVPCETDDTRGHPGRHWWEIQWILDSTAENITVGEGRFIISPEGPI